MFKPKHIISSILMLLPLSVGAQDVDFNFDKTLWFNSQNAAGLYFAPLQDVNTVGFDYSAESGDWHLKQEGQKSSDLHFDTQGALKVGKFNLWGNFSYTNNTLKDASYNTLLYDPSDERFLYNVADTVLSGWKRQAYDMEFKASYPIIEDKLAAGLHLIYTDKIAAKQNDPRAESFNYNITLKPSLSYKMGNHLLGLSGQYSNTFERTVPTLSNVSQSQAVYVLKGLGNYTKETVGSGLSTMFYRCNSWGGALQYSYSSRILFEAGLLHHSTDVTQSASQPQIMGSTSVLDLFARFQMLFGSESALNKVSASFDHRGTSGTEYTTVFESSTNIWEIKSQSVMSEYATTEASVLYERFILDGTSYLWKFYGGAGFKAKNDEYILPEADFNYSNLWAEAGAKHKFGLKRSSLLVGADLRYSHNLSGEYNYSGQRAADALVKSWYPWDLSVLTSDYFKFGGSAAYTHSLKKGMDLQLSLSAAYLAAGDLSRTYFDAGVVLIF